MLFLLTAVNAKYIHSNPAVHSLREFLSEEYKSSVVISEYTINQSLDEILSDIAGKRPEVIGFSCYIWNIKLIRELLAELPKILPDTEIWLGGPEVSYNSEKLLQEFPCVTGIMIGEGEETFYELVKLYFNTRVDENQRLEEKRFVSQSHVNQEFACKLSQIPGLYLRSGSTGERAVMNMNRLPFLYHRQEAFLNRIIYYESSRGCPYRCSYCLSSLDREVRFKDLTLVQKELQHLLDEKVRQVKFVDRTFNSKESHALTIWNYLYEHDNGITNFHFEIAADRISDKELQVLLKMRPGLVQLEIGVQTINVKTLEAIHRLMDINRLCEVVNIIRKQHNIMLHLDLIAGLPYEDYHSFARSFDFVYELLPNQLQLGFLKVLHGTQIEREANQYGICYKSTPPYEVLYTNDLAFSELCKLKRIEEVVELYYNSGQFTCILKALIPKFRSPFCFFEALSEFYEERGYFFSQPSRIYRYHVLLEFIEEKMEAGDYFTECLTYDIYLRENMRSRPSFARNLQPYYDNIRTIYEKEGREHTLLPAYRTYNYKQMEKMTHIEVFHYCVWEGRDITGLSQPQYVLFDYQIRDAITGDAAVTFLPTVSPSLCEK